MTFSARYLANIVRFGTQQGVDSGELLALIGREFEELADEELRFPVAVYNRVLEKALELSGDPYFGLHLGEYLSLSAAGLITQIVQTSGTIREALRHMVAFANLGCQSLPFSLDRYETNWLLSVNPADVWSQQSPASVRHTTDAVLIFTLREYHTLTLQRRRPLEMHFSYDRPQKFLEYEKAFGCPVRFSQPRSGLLLEARQMDQKIVTSDYRLLQVLVQHAQTRLNQWNSQVDFFTLVRNSIVNMIKPQFPTIEQVATNLNISVRTLQRRLKEEGYTFKTVVEELKKQLALDYLTKERLTVKEIAFLLDYADASAFIRSFKRWMGMTPLEYKARL